MKIDMLNIAAGGSFTSPWTRKFAFNAGDQPSATTLTAWSYQDGFAIENLAGFVGDIRNSQKLGRLYFNNLGRAIGNLSLTTSWLPPLNEFNFTQQIPVGNNAIGTASQARLLFPYRSGTPIFSNGLITFANLKGAPEELTNIGDYCLVGNIITLKGIIPSGITISYVATTEHDKLALEGSSDVLIPNYAQCLIGNVCTIEHLNVDTDGYRLYRLTLPTITHCLAKREYHNIPGNQIADDYTVIPLPSQSLTIRYTLPIWLTDFVMSKNSLAFSTEEIIEGLSGTNPPGIDQVDISTDHLFPHGAILLWNTIMDEPASFLGESNVYGTNEIQYKYESASTIIIRVPGEARLVSSASGSSIVYIPDSGQINSVFALIIVGSDLSKKIFELQNDARFSDNNPRNNGQPLNHRWLVGNYLAASSAEWMKIGKFGDHLYYPSNIPGNYHPQYVERAGYSPGSDPSNQDNAHLGDWCIAGDGDTYGTNQGSFVFDERYSSFRKYWSSQFGLFDQFRNFTPFSFNGESLGGYYVLHHGSERENLGILPFIMGHHLRYDRSYFATDHAFWNLSVGEKAARLDDLLEADDSRLTLWHLNGTAPASLRGLPTMAHALELTHGYNNQSTTDDGIFVGRGLRWLDLISGGNANEAGGWAYATGNTTKTSIIGSGSNPNATTIDQFDLVQFLASQSNWNGLPYTYGHFCANSYQGSIYWASDILFGRIGPASRIQFGKFFFSGTGFGGFFPSLGYSNIHKAFGLTDLTYDSDADPTSSNINHFDIQLFGHWSVRGNLSGARASKRGAYKSHWSGTDEFYVGTLELPYNLGGTEFDDTFRSPGTWENLVDWRIDPLGNFNTLGNIITPAVVKAQYFAGEASRVQRPEIPNTEVDPYNSNNPQPVIKHIVQIKSITLGNDADILKTIWYAISIKTPDNWPGNSPTLWLPSNIQCTWLMPDEAMYIYPQTDDAPGDEAPIHQFTVPGTIYRLAGLDTYSSNYSTIIRVPVTANDLIFDVGGTIEPNIWQPDLRRFSFDATATVATGINQYQNQIIKAIISIDWIMIAADELG